MSKYEVADGPCICTSVELYHAHSCRLPPAHPQSPAHPANWSVPPAKPEPEAASPPIINIGTQAPVDAFPRIFGTLSVFTVQDQS